MHLPTGMLYHVSPINENHFFFSNLLTLGSYHGDLGHAYPSPSDSHIIGLCTGLLSSVAVSISSNVGELLPTAVETVVLSLRLGLCVSTTRELFGPKESVDGSWSALVPGCTADEASKVIEDSSREKVCIVRSAIAAAKFNSWS